MIAFTQTPANRPGDKRIFVMSADGTGVRPLTHQQGGWIEGFPVWSPDGKHIAFNRWQEVPGQAGWAGRPIGIASVDDGSVIDAGPTSVDNNGFAFDYSPDGRTILAVSAAVDASGRHAGSGLDRLHERDQPRPQLGVRLGTALAAPGTLRPLRGRPPQRGRPRTS